MISFIVPAHNEEAAIGQTLQAIHDSATMIGIPFEIIVVDDASTDNTAAIARQYHATVVPVNHRQISATRNSGARAAHGDRLFFVDADTIINAKAVASALRYMDKGAAGGGAPVKFDENVPLYAQMIAYITPILYKLTGFSGGAFMFCTKPAFDATGGFNERLYWCEEGAMAMALKREGRFIVVWNSVITSGRKTRNISGLEILGFFFRLIFFPVKMMTQRTSSTQKYWYNSNRVQEDKMTNSWTHKIFNIVPFLLILMMVTSPLWNLVPRSITPWGSPLWVVRLFYAIILYHIGLVLWQLAFVLLAHLVRRMNWIEWFKLAVLTAFCFRQAWDSSLGVIWVWSSIYIWLAT